MKTFELIAPCHFGLEAVLKREIIDLKMRWFYDKRGNGFIQNWYSSKRSNG